MRSPQLLQSRDWTKDGPHIQRLLFAGTSLDWARAPVGRICQETATGRLTVRQRARVLAEWPKKLARSVAVTDTVKRGASGLCDWCGAAARLGSMFTLWPQFQSHNAGGVGYLIEGTHAESAFRPGLRT
jgi:hypothetical protein